VLSACAKWHSLCMIYDDVLHSLVQIAGGSQQWRVDERCRERKRRREFLCGAERAASASQQVGGGDEDRTKRCEQRGVDGGGECGVLEVAVIVMCAV
jgi:hypothetical protein